MPETFEDVCNLEQLRYLVHRTLCRQENILEDQFALTEAPLVRLGKTCGLQFHVQGPRSVRLQAIWAADHNQVYFYDARGSRFLKIRLSRRLKDAAA